MNLEARDSIEGREPPSNLRYTIHLNSLQQEWLSEIRSGFQISRSGWDYREREWSSRKVRETIRTLYGIVTIVQMSGGGYDRLYVPRQNRDAVEEALHTGEFSKEVNFQDIPVLRAIFEKDRDLKRRYGSGWNPRFHQTEVARLAGFGQARTRRSLNNLVGLLGEVVVNDSHYRESSGYSIPITKPRWMIPTARVKDIEGVLARLVSIG